MLLPVAMLQPSTAWAYIGPGAGFAIIGSAISFIATTISAFFLLLFWPVRLLLKRITKKGRSHYAGKRRVVVLGLDGLDHALTKQYVGAGILPNLEKLACRGTFKPLKTTCPPISPVAWSSFQTGVNPGRHNIFDFLALDRRTHQPRLSSCDFQPRPQGSVIRRLLFPGKTAELRLLRKSKPFWHLLGENGIFSNILRVPITFPPQKFHGNLLSAMCAPDLKGTQGTFTLYSSDPSTPGSDNGGQRRPVHRSANRLVGHIEGPDDPSGKAEGRSLSVPFRVELRDDGRSARLYVAGRKVPLAVGEYTDWIGLGFRTRWRSSIAGTCRFYLKQIEPTFELYMTPVNIDPRFPALPISSPGCFGRYLSMQNGLFGTLGLLEDTWALNQGVLDEDAFLKQAYLAHDEREKMFFDALEKTDQGVCACVFDASDRIQHMFWRYQDAGHPAPKPLAHVYGKVIPEMYRKMDGLVGRVADKLGPDDILMVISDHGFKSFRRCVNLNTWLWKNGFLRLIDDRHAGKDYFGDVDWQRTEAYALGMGAIFLNRKGRESRGIVTSSQAPEVKRRIVEALAALRDPKTDADPILRVYDAEQIYNGPYGSAAPEITIGWQDGYRASWESVTGKLTCDIFQDNTKAWSGDHCVDREIVPGVFFTNRKLAGGSPEIIDIAPTILDLFDVDIPGYMEGRVLGLGKI